MPERKHPGDSSVHHAHGRRLGADRRRKLSASVAGEHDAVGPRKWQDTEQSPFVMYFQTWELDAEQPG
jgi:hypothetical protein